MTKCKWLVNYLLYRVESHTFKGLKIGWNGTVSMGNISTSNSTEALMAGHSFTDFTVSGNKVLHIGNCDEGKMTPLVHLGG